MSSPENTPPNPPAPPQTPSTGNPPAEPPPAARIVAEGQRTERELTLERRTRELETRVSELEDENHQLKTPAAPKPKRKTLSEEIDEWIP
jgi:hypothetical protein